MLKRCDTHEPRDARALLSWGIRHSGSPHKAVETLSCRKRTQPYALSRR